MKNEKGVMRSNKMKVLILGTAGQISQMVRKNLLVETNHELVLYARNANQRLSLISPDRETIISGDFQDYVTLLEAMKDVDIVYLNDMNHPENTEVIVQAMKEADVKYIIGANILGIYDEVVGAFGKWNARMVGQTSTKRHRDAADILENSGINYVNLRLTWLYNETANEKYQISDKGEPFIGAQVSRQAVARLISTIIDNPDEYANRNLGVSEANTNFSKPSFY